MGKLLEQTELISQNPSIGNILSVMIELARAIEEIQIRTEIPIMPELKPKTKKKNV